MHRAEQPKLLQEKHPAVGEKDVREQQLDRRPTPFIPGKRLDAQRLAEEKVNHRVDPPGDVVFDDDFLPRHALDGQSRVHIERHATAAARDARGHSPFLRLPIRAIRALLVALGAARKHRVAVIHPEPPVVLGTNGQQLIDAPAQLVGIDGQGWIAAGPRMGQSSDFAVCHR
jgi:hypothetical protein